jgi:hypothetical protein
MFASPFRVYTTACRYLIKPILLCKLMKQTKNKQQNKTVRHPGIVKLTILTVFFSPNAFYFSLLVTSYKMLLWARKNFNALRGRVFWEIFVLNSLGLNSVCGNPVQEERHLSVDTCT